MRIILKLFCFVLLISLTALSYYGGKSAEALLTFTAVADVPMSGVKDVATLNHPGRFQSEAREQIDLQVQHLMGVFQSDTFQKAVGSRGTIGETYDIKYLKIEDGSKEGRKRLAYRFRGKSVFEKAIFDRNRKATVPIKLPISPDLIYKQSSEGDHNPCTDEHYNTEGDFWYFWDPDQKGCGLKGDDKQVYRGEGLLSRIDKLKRPTYPEYNKLLGDNGNSNAFDIRIFFGYIDEKVNIKPNRRDDAFRSMLDLEKSLKDQDFKKTEENVGFRETKSGMVKDGGNILRKYQKEINYSKLKSDPVDVRIQVLLSDTSVEAAERSDKPDLTFHHYLIPAFKEADLLLYDGHSGLGANLDLKRLDRFRFDKDKYQIFVFNGCSTYPYYNGAFFAAKGGRRLNNLEVVTSGLPTLSSTSASNMASIMNRFLDGKLATYQTIMRELEDSNGDAGTYLSAVNGDEDNRWRPKK
jgi:hypothetical protein